MNKRIYVLSALALVLMIGIVSATNYANKINLDVGWNNFSIMLNSSSQVTGDINYSLDSTPSGTSNFIGYSSNTPISVNDVIFYDASHNSKTYAQAKIDGWTNGELIPKEVVKKVSEVLE